MSEVHDLSPDEKAWLRVNSETPWGMVVGESLGQAIEDETYRDELAEVIRLWRKHRKSGAGWWSQ